MVRELLVVVVLGLGVIGPPTGVAAEVWNSQTDYSMTKNPNGPWSYRRTWTVDAASADLMTHRWGVNEDGDGWYTGNIGNGGPSICSWGVWAKNNGNGYPDIRWTSPATGLYDLSWTFSGIDDRGNDNMVYVDVNGTVKYSGHIRSYLDTACGNLSSVPLQQGDHVDFVVTWNGGVYSEYAWTNVKGTIQAVPEPASALLLLSLGSMMLVRRRQHDAPTRLSRQAIATTRLRLDIR